MISQTFFRYFFGSLVFFLATPAGMAKVTVPEEVRADFFCALNVGDYDQLSAVLSANVKVIETQENLSADVDELDAQENLSSTDFEEDGRPAMVSFNDAALLPGAELYEQSETSVEGEQEETGSRKRHSSAAKILQKCRYSSPFTANSAAKGVAKHPLTQDAGQERTAAIRFLQICSLDC